MAWLLSLNPSYTHTHDPFNQTIGKQVDETDKAFYTWKKCVQCALSDEGVTPLIKPDGGIPAYQYDERTDSCGMLISC